MSMKLSDIKTMSDMEYNWADCPMCDEKDKRIEELESEVERLRLKFADTTEGLCPVCGQSLEADDDLWLCESCGWKEKGDE